MAFHTIVIVGNLGKEPELKYAPNGNGVCELNVASNRQYTSAAGEKVKEVTWFRVSVWGKQAESCNTYLHKGSSVLVEGKLRPDKETGGPRVYQRTDGSSGASYEVTARTVRFLSGKSGETSGDATEEEDFPF
jgi:single-strand DNA-binding protein